MQCPIIHPHDCAMNPFFIFLCPDGLVRFRFYQPKIPNSQVVCIKVSFQSVEAFHAMIPFLETSQSSEDCIGLLRRFND